MDGKLLPDDTPFDPNSFALDWAVLFEALALIIVLAFIVERVLALFLETEIFLKFYAGQKSQNKLAPSKPLIALLFAFFLICHPFQVDLLAILFSHVRPSLMGEFITAAIIAGGSKASIKLFRDILAVRSNAYDEYKKGNYDKKP